MTELVIDAPHLQTISQRLGALVVTVVGWLLWGYFFFPLVMLAGWSLDCEACSPWVNLSGGFLNLREWLLIYACTIAAMAGLWSMWALYNAVRSRWVPRFRHKPPVDLAELSQSFGIDAVSLRQCQKSRYAVVHCDDGGRIVKVTCDPS